MGHVLSCGLDLISSGVGTHVDHALKQRMETLESLANKSNISYREKLHAKAVKQWAEGYESKSTVCHVTQLKCIIPFFFFRRTALISRVLNFLRGCVVLWINRQPDYA